MWTKPPMNLFRQLLLDFESPPDSFVKQKNMESYISDRYFTEKCSIVRDIVFLVKSNKNLKNEITTKAFNYRSDDFCLTDWIYCGPMIVHWMVNNIVKGSSYDMCLKVVDAGSVFNNDNSNTLEEYGPKIVLHTLLSRKKYHNFQISDLLLRVTNGNTCLLNTLFEHITDFDRCVWRKMACNKLCTKRKTSLFIERVPLDVCRDVLGSEQCRLESFWFILLFFRGVCDEKGLATLIARDFVNLLV